TGSPTRCAGRWRAPASATTATSRPAASSSHARPASPVAIRTSAPAARPPTSPPARPRSRACRAKASVPASARARSRSVRRAPLWCPNHRDAAGALVELDLEAQRRAIFLIGEVGVVAGEPRTVALGAVLLFGEPQLRFDVYEGLDLPALDQQPHQRVRIVTQRRPGDAPELDALAGAQRGRVDLLEVGKPRRIERPLRAARRADHLVGQ